MEVSLRTVQRDLNALAEIFDESKPQGWWWREGASQLEVPSMDAHSALTFNLVEQYMQNMLPRSTLSHMVPWFEAAQGVVSSQASSVTRWRDKLRVIPHTLNKIPAPIDAAIQATIYTGLLDERQLQVTYRAITSGKEAKTYPVHPLGLVEMEQVVYLVCTVKDYQNARFLAVHRIDAAELLEAAAVRPVAFDIDEFIAREFGIRLAREPLDLVLRIRGILAKYLAETPVAIGQLMTPIDDDWTRVEVRVHDTIQLRNWLRSLGPDAVVEEPASIREHLRSEWMELIGLHGGG
jgi:predicted DNA-binding transcriptional regulator YafY